MFRRERSPWGLWLDSLAQQAARWRTTRRGNDEMTDNNEVVEEQVAVAAPPEEQQQVTKPEREGGSPSLRGIIDAMHAENARLREALEYERRERHEQERVSDSFRRQSAFAMARELRPDLVGSEEAWPKLRAVAEDIYGWMTGSEDPTSTVRVQERTDHYNGPVLGNDPTRLGGPGWQPAYDGPRASDDLTVEERDREERR
jgi:hypothetical protein